MSSMIDSWGGTNRVCQAWLTSRGGTNRVCQAWLTSRGGTNEVCQAWLTAGEGQIEYVKHDWHLQGSHTSKWGNSRVFQG